MIIVVSGESHEHTALYILTTWPSPAAFPSPHPLLNVRPVIVFRSPPVSRLFSGLALFSTFRKSATRFLILECM